MAWRVWAWAVVVVVVVVGVVEGEDRWVWSKSTTTTNTKASSIPGFVQPTTSSTTTTPPPPVTTFHPRFQPVGRGASSRRRHFSRVSANPFYLGPFPVPAVSPPRTAPDGTTKSRVTADTAFDGASGAALDVGDKYTTLDRLQSERGAAPPLPRPQEHQLGGLHPDEVFYADDDLLIIKGGGFTSDAFEEPSQPLDGEDGDIREGSPSRVSTVVAPLPSPHQEYNGNIPAIVPPPRQGISHQPYSLFVEGASSNSYVLVPYVYPQPQVGVARDGAVTNRIDTDHRNIRQPAMVIPYVYPQPFPVAAIRRPPTHPHSAGYQQPGTLTLPHSLKGDTDVNFKHPRPPINPEAEVFAPVDQHTYYYPGRVRQRGRPKL